MLALGMIISVILGFILGFYTCSLMVMKDRKELKRIMETALEKERKTGKWIKDIYGNVVCSECRANRRDNRIGHIAFCNSCGAKMEVDE